MSRKLIKSLRDVAPSFTKSAVQLRSPLREVPPHLREQVFVESIPLGTWGEITNATGEPLEELTYDRVTSHLSDLVTPALIDALETIKALGNDDTIEDLRRLERTLGRVLPRTWRPDDPAIEQIAHLWVVALEDENVANYVSIARAYRLKRPEAQRMYWSKKERPIWNQSREVGFRDALAKEFGERGLGSYVEILHTRTVETLTLYVIRSKRPRSLVCVNEQQTARETLRVREAVCDILMFDATLGRLEVRASRSWLAELYQRELAEAAFGNREFFGLPGTFTLEPIQRDGSAALPTPTDDPEIIGVTLRRCVHAPTRREQFTYQSKDDLFSSLAKNNVSLTRGELVEVKIAFKFGGLVEGRTTVVIQPPNRWTCPDRYRGSVMHYLEKVGIFAAAPNGRTDMWTLGLEPHSADRWACALGCDVNKLDELGFLKVAEEISRERDDDDLIAFHSARSYRLLVEDLASAMSVELELQHPASKPAEPGIWDLGSREIGPRTFRFFFAFEEPKLQPAALRALLPIQHSEEPVLLVPPRREWPSGGGVKTVMLESLTPPFELMRTVVRALHLESHVPAIHFAPPGRRLVIDSERGLAWLDGGELKLTSAQYDLLHEIARNTLDSKSTPVSGSVPGHMKQTKAQLVKALRQVAATLGRPHERIIGPGRHGGYRLTSAPWIWPVSGR